MKIWDYIKDKLFNKKKSLPEPKENNANVTGIKTKKQAFDELVKADVDIKPNTIEFAIDKYMSAILEENISLDKLSTYNVLIRIGALPNVNDGNNLNNQKKFIEDVNKDLYGYRLDVKSDMEIDENATKNDFYHAINVWKSAEDIKYRIYLNCEKTNVVELASRFAKELENQDFYFKFGAAENESERSEKFVFYLGDEEDLEQKISVINKINRENPELFKNAHSVNPFLKTRNGYIAYAPEIHEGIYNNLSGERKVIDKSYNTLLSEALQDSLLKAVKEIAMEDFELPIESGVYNFTDIRQLHQSKLLDCIYYNQNLKMKAIELIKKKLEIISERNPELDIKGIDTKSKKSGKNFTDYTPENY